MSFTLARASRLARVGKQVGTLAARRPAATPTPLVASSNVPRLSLSRHSAVRFKTGDAVTPPPQDVAKSQRMLKEMESVLGEKSAKQATVTTTTTADAAATSNVAAAGSAASLAAAAEANTKYKARRQQAIINGIISFVTVLLSAQVLKIGTQKRKLEIQVQVLEEILADKRALLRSLESEEKLRPVAEQCAKDIVESRNATKSWWGSGAGSNKTNASGETQEQQLAERILVSLRAGMQQTIGQEGMTDTEKDMSALQDLQPDELSQAAESDKLLEEELLKLLVEQPNGETVVKQPNGETVVKTRVFSI